MIVSTNGILHDHTDAGAHEAALHGYARSPHFEVMCRNTRAADGGVCAISGSPVGTERHHCIIPFHIARYFGRWELEFSPRNLCWLQQVKDNEIHRVAGHCLFFQSFNPTLLEDIRRWKGWTAQHIMDDPLFHKAVCSRPKSLRDMNEKELTWLRNRIEALLPLEQTELALYAPYKPSH